MSNARTGFTLWFIIGSVVAAVFQIGQAGAMGGPMGLIQAGADYPLADVISAEIPGVPLSNGIGHDGQIFYAIGLDPAATYIPEVLPDASYRYRRILFPALASGLGSVHGSTLVWSMAGISALSVGVAAGVAFMIGHTRGLHRWLPLVVVLNPGLWLSVRLLTADALALALGLGAVAAYLRRRDAWCLLLLCAAVLTRETSIVFAIGLGGHAWSFGEAGRAARLLAAPGMALLGWLAFIQLRIGDALTSGGNLGIPGLGIAQSVEVWADQGTSDNVWIACTLAAILVGILATRGRPGLTRWLLWPWIGVALVASHLVWEVGNNAIRTLAPVVTLAGWAMIERLGRRSSELSVPASP